MFSLIFCLLSKEWVHLSSWLEKSWKSLQPSHELINDFHRYWLRLEIVHSSGNGFVAELVFGVGCAADHVGLRDWCLSAKLDDCSRSFGTIHLRHAVVNDHQLEDRFSSFDEFFDSLNRILALLEGLILDTFRLELTSNSAQVDELIVNNCDLSNWVSWRAFYSALI